MANFEENIRTPSQDLGTSQDGKVIIDYAQSVIKFLDPTGLIEMLKITKDGILLNDGTDRRMIIGVMPTGEIGVVISKQGEDVIDIFS